MTTFSRRNGYNQNDIQLECASDTLKERIYARFYKQEFFPYSTNTLDHLTTGIEDVMIEMGLTYNFPDSIISKNKNSDKLRRYVTDSEWYICFDFIEKYLRVCNRDTSKLMEKEFNHILEDEVSAYRVEGGLVVPITNETELNTIKVAMDTKYEAVNTHISKALSLYADRKKPDYENSIKESISAVESMCCIITGQTGSRATLGKTIKKLQDGGVHIHQSLVNGFSALYGYTSDEDGIRHGGIDFSNAPAEDAKFMLVSCSAFVNYLIEKWSKLSK